MTDASTPSREEVVAAAGDPRPLCLPYSPGRFAFLDYADDSVTGLASR